MSQASPSEIEDRINAAWLLAEAKPAVAGSLKTAPIQGLSRSASATVSEHGFRGIFIPVAAGELIRIGPEFRANAAGALRAELAQFTSAGGAAKALHVWCVETECRGAFTAFATMFVDKIHSADLGQLLLACFEEFQRLVGFDDSDTRSTTGLFGELLALRDLVLVEPSAIATWSGPRGERHDFRSRSIALEIKTSSRANSKTSRIHVSDWDQLEIPDGGHLYLHVIRIEQCEGGEWSVARLVSDITSRLDESGRALLKERLDRFHGSVVQSQTEYSIMSRTTYRVAGDFPRLVQSSMRHDANVAGVSAVSYDLDLSFATGHQTDWETAIEHLIGSGSDA